jgi:hypothetical protein
MVEAIRELMVSVVVGTRPPRCARGSSAVPGTLRTSSDRSVELVSRDLTRAGTSSCVLDRSSTRIGHLSILSTAARSA